MIKRMLTFAAFAVAGMILLATPAAAQSCVAGPYMVFFDRDSEAITPQAAAILDNAVSNYASCGGSPVLLQGHADLVGSSEYSIGLSQRRALSVRSYLATHGISDSVITTEAFGDNRPLVETSDGVREPQNNRVEITYGQGSNASGSVMEGSSNGEAGPLGLRGAPAPSQTGALAPDNRDRYWLRGRIINESSAECGRFCPSLGVGITIYTPTTVPSSRQTGGTQEFGFGDPMEDGTAWIMKITQQPHDGFYD